MFTSLSKYQINYMEIKKPYLKKVLLYQLTAFILGILCSKGKIFGRYFPFGVSLISVVPEGSIFYATIGLILGYLTLPHTSLSIRYISTVIAILAIRWTLNDIQKIKNHIVTPLIISFITTSVTGMALEMSAGFDIRSTSMVIMESTLTAIVSYFFKKSLNLFNMYKKSISLQELSYIIICIDIVIFSASSIQFSTISLSHILSIFLILISSYCYGIIGGTLSGITSGIILNLSHIGTLYISNVYSFGGIIAGIFAKYGKLYACFGILIANFFTLYQFGNISSMISVIYETIIGVLIFIMVPKEFLNYIKNLISDTKKNHFTYENKNLITQKLNSVSKSILSISKFMNTTFNEFSNTKVPHIEDICLKSAYRVCNRCSLRKLCWEKDIRNTKQTIKKLATIINDEQAILDEPLINSMRNRCKKTDAIINNIRLDYTDIQSQNDASYRAKELNNVVVEQFTCMGCLLNDMATELNFYEHFDSEKVNKIKQKLTALGIYYKNIICKVDTHNKLIIEIESDFKYLKKIKEHRVAKELSKICLKNLYVSNVDSIGGIVRIDITEKTNFNVNIGMAQHSCNNSNFCGDNCSFFFHDTGSFISIITDGMGTGGRAAIDGATTCELMGNLIKSGISFETAIKIINSMLLVSSVEESLVTLDVLNIDLFNGNIKFLKAGSPMTFIKTSGKVLKIDVSSLPIGIFNQATFSTTSTKIHSGDIIVMLSDGATDIGEDWIIKILQNFNDNNMNRLSEQIVNKAVSKRKQSHDDDITALSILVT